MSPRQLVFKRIWREVVREGRRGEAGGVGRKDSSLRWSGWGWGCHHPTGSKVPPSNSELLCSSAACIVPFSARPPFLPLGSKVHLPRESVVLGGLPGADTPSQDTGLFPEGQASSLIQVFLAKTHLGADEQSSDVRGNTPLDKGLCSSCKQTELVSMP